MKPSNRSKMTAPMLLLEFEASDESPFLHGCRSVAQDMEVYITMQGGNIQFMVVGEARQGHSAPILLN